MFVYKNTPLMQWKQIHVKMSVIRIQQQILAGKLLHFMQEENSIASTI